nr:HEPN domain-containing protein [Murimonas intestini]
MRGVRKRPVDIVVGYESSFETRCNEETLEIICYHCQQAVEKLLKDLLISNNKTIQKTHDLEMLIALLQEEYDILEEILDICDNLTPYGVKSRYPQELFIEEFHAKKAIEEMKQLFE